jgi:hypothetical protein
MLAEFPKLLERISWLEQGNTEKDADAAASLERISSLEQGNAASLERISSLEQGNTVKDADAAASRARISSLEQVIASLEQANTEKDAVAAVSVSRIAALEVDVVAKGATIASQDGRLATLESVDENWMGRMSKAYNERNTPLLQEFRPALVVF